MPPIVRDRAVIVEETLVIADLHLGREQSSNLELAVGTDRSLLDRLGSLLTDTAVTEVVIAGDLLDAFDSLPPAVASVVDELRETVAEHDCDLVVTLGNHDVLLDAIWDGPTPSEYRLSDGETVVLHGHERPEIEASRYVIGHDHPAIEIEGRKRPCYLRGPAGLDGTEILMLPTFNELVSGVRINGMTAADFHSPLVSEVDVLRPIVRDATAGETLTFPPLGSLREHL